ncbi:MAG: sensor histidine kinase [Spirochaetaceae bacterium]
MPRHLELRSAPLDTESWGSRIVIIADVSSYRQEEKYLHELNESLERRVQRRTVELEETIKNLTATQRSLVEAEKLAAIGTLIAGISHEVNTPLGVAVTAASYVDRLSRDIAAAGADGADGTDGAVASLQEASQLLIQNLDRAAKLVQGFKEITHQQAWDELEKFDLLHQVEQLLHMLSPQLRKANITVELSGERNGHHHHPAGPRLTGDKGARPGGGEGNRLMRLLPDHLERSVAHRKGTDQGGDAQQSEKGDEHGYRRGEPSLPGKLEGEKSCYGYSRGPAETGVDAAIDKPVNPYILKDDDRDNRQNQPRREERVPLYRPEAASDKGYEQYEAEGVRDPQTSHSRCPEDALHTHFYLLIG